MKNPHLFGGNLGGVCVDMDGSEPNGHCVIRGWIGDGGDIGHYGFLIGRMRRLIPGIHKGPDRRIAK